MSAAAGVCVRGAARTVVSSRERGSGTVAATGLVAAAMVLLVVVTLGVQLAAARARAQTAADLGAVAAATVRYAGDEAAVLPAGLGADAACAVARRVASGSSARVRSCWLDGADVRVEVAVAVPGVAGRILPAALARARAGPASS